MTSRYPGAHFQQSPETEGQLRDDTLGVVWHWTAGREPGDVSVLSRDDPRSVNVQFYIPKDGTTPTPGKGVYQFTETDERANHAMHTANHFMVGVEMEGSGEPWSPVQYDNAVALGVWLSLIYTIPIVHCDPSGHDLSTFRGHCGHVDLSLGGERVDGNDHTDTVPNPPGWLDFLTQMRGGQDTEAFRFESLPFDEGGVGPKILGQAAGYAREGERDKALGKIVTANPGLIITKLKARDGRFYILAWGDPRGRDWYRSQGFATEAKRNLERIKRESNLPGVAIRDYRGTERSLYPWAAADTN